VAGRGAEGRADLGWRGAPLASGAAVNLSHRGITWQGSLDPCVSPASGNQCLNRCYQIKGTCHEQTPLRSSGRTLVGHNARDSEMQPEFMPLEDTAQACLFGSNGRVHLAGAGTWLCKVTQVNCSQHRVAHFPVSPQHSFFRAMGSSEPSSPLQLNLRLPLGLEWNRTRSQPV
jgi:hypothetical protein